MTALWAGEATTCRGAVIVEEVEGDSGPGSTASDPTVVWLAGLVFNRRQQPTAECTRAQRMVPKTTASRDMWACSTLADVGGTEIFHCDCKHSRYDNQSEEDLPCQSKP